MNEAGMLKQKELAPEETEKRADEMYSNISTYNPIEQNRILAIVFKIAIKDRQCKIDNARMNAEYLSKSLTELTSILSDTN